MLMAAINISNFQWPFINRKHLIIIIIIIIIIIMDPCVKYLENLRYVRELLELHQYCSTIIVQQTLEEL